MQSSSNCRDICICHGILWRLLETIWNFSIDSSWQCLRFFIDSCEYVTISEITMKWSASAWSLALEEPQSHKQGHMYSWAWQEQQPKAQSTIHHRAPQGASKEALNYSPANWNGRAVCWFQLMSFLLFVIWYLSRSSLKLDLWQHLEDF